MASTSKLTNASIAQSGHVIFILWPEERTASYCIYDTFLGFRYIP